MRFFELLNFQHVVASVLIALIFMVLFGVGLAFTATIKSKKDGTAISQSFSDGLAKADGPYPLIITIIIAGTILWAFFYILFYGISEVKL